MENNVEPLLGGVYVVYVDIFEKSHQNFSSEEVKEIAWGTVYKNPGLISFFCIEPQKTLASKEMSFESKYHTALTGSAPN